MSRLYLYIQQVFTVWAPEIFQQYTFSPVLFYFLLCRICSVAKEGKKIQLLKYNWSVHLHNISTGKLWCARYYGCYTGIAQRK